MTKYPKYPKYPKMETLYDRDPETFRVIPERIRLKEFMNIKRWMVTEKIHGTNLIVMWDGRLLTFGGRTEKAQIGPHETAAFEPFTSTVMSQVFPDIEPPDGSPPDTPVVKLYGEGYGGKIQSGGNYQKEPGFRLFDVRVGHLWLQWENVVDVAHKLGIETVPVLAESATLDQALVFVTGRSVAGVMGGGEPDYQREGIVARTNPLLMDRRGQRIMWKLKATDFTKGKR